MEWIFLSIVFIGIVVYEVVDRYFEYKENTERSDTNEYRR